MKEIDYRDRYELFKKLPFYLFVATIVSFSIFGIIDYLNCITDFGYDEFSLFVWPLIGVACGFINWFVCSLVISPTIVIADSVLDIAENAKK